MAYIESECFSDSIVGYDAETVPILEIPEEDKHICTGNRKSARVEIRYRDTESSRHKIHIRLEVIFYCKRVPIQISHEEGYLFCAANPHIIRFELPISF